MRDQLRQHLIDQEGVRLKPYTDTEGKLTIGVGRCLDTEGITTAEANELLDHDIDGVTSQLDKELPWWKSRSDSTQIAMASMAFQLGMTGLLKFSRMLSCLQAGDYEGAKREGLDSEWARQTPNRAKAVTDLFVP